MTLGRNDPCPCGSGRKYKKCCLNKTPHGPAPEIPATVEPRFHSPATSYYTQAALAEASKPGGMVQIHPYVLLKLRDDPRLLQSAEPADRVRLLQLWKPSKLTAMSNEEIQTRLSLLGVHCDRAQFIDSASTHQSAWAIADEWSRDLGPLSLADKHFLGLAACELWRRFCPERPSLEMIDDWLCEGYGFVAQGKRTAAMESWWKVWETLRARLRPEMRNLNEAGDHLFPRMSQCLSNWSVDFRLEALNGSLDDASCGEVGVRFVRELLETLPEEDHDLNLSGDLAMLYFALHRDAEAERCCQKLIHNHPDRAVGYIVLSDGLIGSSRNRPAPPVRLQHAIELLEAALAYPVKDADDFDVPARLARARALLLKARHSGQ